MDMGNKVRVYIEFFDSGYRTVIVYIAKSKKALNHDYLRALMNKYLTDM